MDSGGLWAAQGVRRGGEGRAACCTDTAPDTSAVGPTQGAHWRLFLGEEEEEEEEEVEETSSWFLIFSCSWPRSSTTAAVALMLCWFSW